MCEDMERYTEINEIHSNGESADIFEVKDPIGNIFIRKRLLKSADKDQRKRFLNEIALLHKIKSPFLIPIIDFDIASPLPYYIMPKAYKNLREYLHEKNGYSEIALFEQIVQGVRELHERKILHLDLNPDNVLIFVCDDGTINAKVSDLGLAMHIDDVKNAKGNDTGWHGTHRYIPYRDLKSIKNADFSSDIYNLGRILHRILTGEQCRRDSVFFEEGGYFGVIIRKAIFDVIPNYKNINAFIDDIEEAKRIEASCPSQYFMRTQSS